MEIEQNLLNKIKEKDNPDSFYLSTKQNVMESSLKRDPLVGSAPAIGKYGQLVGNDQQYNFLNPLVFIENKPSTLLTVIPDSLSKALLQETKQPIQNLVAAHSVDFFTIVFGSPFLEKPADRIYNLVFHPVLRKWLAGSVNPNNFSVVSRVGIFEPNGVKNISVSVDSFSDESIHVHPSGDNVIAYSPDNIKIQIVPGRNIVSFWSAALSPDKSKIVIVYNLIIDNENVETKLGHIVKTSWKLESLIQGLRTFAQEMPQIDRPALNNVVTILTADAHAIVKPVDKGPQTVPEQETRPSTVTASPVPAPSTITAQNNQLAIAIQHDIDVLRQKIPNDGSRLAQMQVPGEYQKLKNDVVTIITAGNNEFIIDGNRYQRPYGPTLKLINRVADALQNWLKTISHN